MKVSKLGLFSAAVASLATSSAAFAAMDMDSRVTQLETHMQQVRTENAMGTSGAGTATARPEVDGQGFSFNADVLYWRAKVGGTEYAYRQQSGTGQTPISGSLQDISFDWDWGFKVGAGYNFQHDNWDVAAKYTYFNSNVSASTEVGNNNALLPLRGATNVTNLDGKGVEFDSCKKATSEYGLKFQSVELQLGRDYYVSSKLSFRPNWGVKSAWIDQSQKTRYSGGKLDGNTVHVDDKNNFWGVGPAVGIDSKWHLGSGFSVFGNLGGSLLFGHFDVDQKSKWSSVDNAKVTVDGSRHAFAPNMQMVLGLHYDTYLNNNKQHIGVGLGFEANYLWRQNQMVNANDATACHRYSDDVSLHGVTLDFKWDF